MKKIIKDQMVKWLSHIPLAAVALRARIAQNRINTLSSSALSGSPT